MSIPRRHHYLPQFYQRRWATNGHVVVYRRFPSGLSILRKPPSSVGFLENLYTNPSDPNEKRREVLESKVFQSIDNDAADALNFIETEGEPPYDGRRRSGWARFIMSLNHRAPRRFDALRAEVRRKRVEIIREMQGRRGITPELLESELHNHAGADATHVRLVNDLVNSHRVGSHIVKMNWSIVRFRSQNFQLVTSDRPLIRNSGIAKPNGFIILPISPDSYFIAANRNEVLDWFYELDSKLGSKTINDMVVRQAEEFVVCKDERQTRFVENRLLKETANRDRDGEVTWEVPLLP